MNGIGLVVIFTGLLSARADYTKGEQKSLDRRRYHMILVIIQCMGRPSHAELRRKILKARAKITAADWHMASPEKQAAEFRELNLWTAAEMT